MEFIFKVIFTILIFVVFTKIIMIVATYIGQRLGIGKFSIYLVEKIKRLVINLKVFLR